MSSGAIGQWERVVQSALRRVLRWFPRAETYREDLAQEGRMVAWQASLIPTVGLPQHWFIWRKVHNHLREQARAMVNTVHQPQRERGWVSYEAEEALATMPAPLIDPSSTSERPLRLVRALDSVARKLPEHHSSSVASRTLSVEMYYRHQQGETLNELSGDFGMSPQAVRKRILTAARSLEPSGTAAAPEAVLSALS